MYAITIKIICVLFGIMIAQIIYSKIISPKLYYPNCLINAQNCITVEYYILNNTFLAYVYPDEYWIWYNGDAFFIINNLVLRGTCGSNEIRAMRLDPNTFSGVQYECIINLDQIKSHYKKIKVQYITIRKTKADTGAVDIIKKMLEDEIFVYHQ